jgi:peptidoglycan/LPS O-acetylase OafA/YrhL
MNPKASGSPHYPALDGLRGVAILLVLIHMLNLLETQDGLAAYVFYRISHAGWTGVQLFFVLSGFLITGILLDSRSAKNRWSSFYMRRVLRIFPLYYSVLAITFFVLPAAGVIPESVAADEDHQIWLWTYLTNWAPLFGAGSKTFPHFWSLAVEEQFYLVWPLLIRSRGPASCLKFCLVVAAVSLTVRCLLFWYAVPGHLIYENSFCRMDALALGGVAAAALRIPDWREKMLATSNRLLVSSGLLFAISMAVTRGFWTGTPAGATVGYTLVAACFALLLLAIVSAEALASSTWVRIFRIHPLRALGKYSYAMYVFHKPVHDFVGRSALIALDFDVSQSILWSTIYMVIVTALTFAVAFVSWHVLERHFLRLKRFFVPNA